MIAYIVVDNTDYEGTEVVGVFSALASAIAVCRERLPDVKDGRRDSNRTCSVELWNVDGDYVRQVPPARLHFRTKGEVDRWVP